MDGEDGAQKAGRPRPRAHLRRRLYVLLEGGDVGWGPAAWLRLFLIVLVVLNVALAFVGSGIPHGGTAYIALLAFEAFTLLVFSVEYAARLWVAVEDPRYRGTRPLAAQLAYARSPEAIVDLVAILPMLVVLTAGADLRGLLLVRFLRLLKLFRYSSGMKALADAVAAEARSLAACGVILLTVVAVSASAIHYAERGAQPDVFDTLGRAFWWSIVTITTVGYGDTVPVTDLGRAIAMATMVIGFAFIALPIAILSSSFADVIRNRDFQVTWAPVGEVPLLSSLDVATVARWLPRLIARSFGRGDLVSSAGMDPRELNLVVSGTLEAETAASTAAESGLPAYLGPGAAFGGPIPLRRLGIRGPILALSDTRVLVISADDLALIERHRPDLMERIRSAASRGRVDGPRLKPRHLDAG